LTDPCATASPSGREWEVSLIDNEKEQSISIVVMVRGERSASSRMRTNVHRATHCLAVRQGRQSKLVAVFKEIGDCRSPEAIAEQFQSIGGDERRM